MQNISVADTRQHLAEILGKVAYAGEAFLITKKGKPMARLVPVRSSTSKSENLFNMEGWLEDGDPFFKNVELARKESRRHSMTDPFRRKK